MALHVGRWEVKPSDVVPGVWKSAADDLLSDDALFAAIWAALGDGLIDRKGDRLVPLEDGPLDP